MKKLWKGGLLILLIAFFAADCTARRGGGGGSRGGGGRSHSSSSGRGSSGRNFSRHSGRSTPSYSHRRSGGRSSSSRSLSRSGAGRSARVGSSGRSYSRSSRVSGSSRAGWRRSAGSGYHRRSSLFSHHRYRSYYWNRPLGLWGWGLLGAGWSYFDPLYGFYYPGYGYYYCGGVGFFVPHARFGYRYGYWTYPFADLTYTVYVADQSDREIVLSNGTQSDLYFAFYYQDSNGMYVRDGIPRLLERIDTGQIYVPRSRRGMSRFVIISHNDGDLGQEIAPEAAQRLTTRSIDVGSGRLMLKAIEDNNARLTRLIDLTEEELNKIDEIQKRIQEDKDYLKQAEKEYKQRKSSGDFSQDSEGRGPDDQPREHRKAIERESRYNEREQEDERIDLSRQEDDGGW